MKKTTTWSGVRQVTRREFVGSAIAAGAVFAHAPAVLRGQNLNSKLNIAVIGAGGRGRASLNELTLDPANPPKRTDGSGSLDKHPDENIVALCDINQESLDSAGVRLPEGREVHRPPEGVRQARRLRLRRGRHRRAHARVRDLPRAHARQARLLREAARLQHLGNTPHSRDGAETPNLSTQMGNQGHASPARRMIKEILNTGVIGKVNEVHVWAEPRVGPAGRRIGREVRQAARVLQRHPDRRSVPRDDAGAGQHPLRPVDRARARAAVPRDLLPGPRWYRWWDFGNGTMSDLGSHDNDVPYTVLDLWRQDAKAGRYLAPLTVAGRVANGQGAQGTGAGHAQGHLRLRRRGQSARAQAGVVPGRRQATGLDAGVGRQRSCIFMGEKGMLLGNGKLLPEDRFVDFKAPPESIPRSPGHWVEWVDHARAPGPVPGSNFQYARVDDRSQSPRQRRVPDREEDRVGLAEHEGEERAGSRAVRPASRVPQGMGRDTENVERRTQKVGAPLEAPLSLFSQDDGPAFTKPRSAATARWTE